MINPMTVQKSLSFILGALAVVFAAVAYHYYVAYSSLGNLVINPENSRDNIFQVASSTGDVYLTVTADGKTGVQTAVPQTELDVRGMARVYTSSSAPCTQNIEGAIAYDPAQKHFFGCTADAWKQLDN